MNLRKDHLHIQSNLKYPMNVRAIWHYKTYWKANNWNFHKNTNFQQWMSWLPYRWRTQQSAISNANCRLWVNRILNAYGTDWYSSQYTCFSVSLINEQYLNAGESKTLLFNTRARCLYGWLRSRSMQPSLYVNSLWVEQGLPSAQSLATLFYLKSSEITRWT